MTRLTREHRRWLKRLACGKIPDSEWPLGFDRRGRLNIFDPGEPVPPPRIRNGGRAPRARPAPAAERDLSVGLGFVPNMTDAEMRRRMAREVLEGTKDRLENSPPIGWHPVTKTIRTEMPILRVVPDEAPDRARPLPLP